MSWDLIRQEVGTKRAGEDMSAARGKAVVFNSLDRWQIAGLSGPLAGTAHGILTNSPVNGGVASVQVFGIVPAKLGGTVAGGRYLDIDANGDLIENHPDGQVGVALENGEAGDIIPVLLVNRTSTGGIDGVVSSATLALGILSLGRTAALPDVTVDLNPLVSGIDHGSISGLADNDHPQYVNGSLAYTGNLNMGLNAIINVTTVDGVDLSALNIAFNAHAADSNIHFTVASIDHGAISGLADDDHPQYHDGSLPYTAALNMGGFAITNVAAVDGVDISTLPPLITANAVAAANAQAAAAAAQLDITTHRNGSVDDHGDVDTTSTLPQTGEVMAWDGANWVPTPSTTFGEYVGSFDASIGTFPVTNYQGDWFNTTVAGTVGGEAFAAGDLLIALVDNPSTTVFAGNWTRIPNISVTDHTLLTNIGVNTHAQIDTHLGDASVHFTEASITHANIIGVGTNTHAQIDTHIGDATLHFTEGSINHASIANIGINTHPQIDTHIADGTVHFTEASIDHTAIASIGTNSHAVIDAHIADSTIHFTAGSLNTTYLQLDAANGPLTGTLGTQILRPSVTETYDIGSTSLRYQQLWAEEARVFEGNGTLIAPAPSHATSKGAVIGYAQNNGTGTATIEVGHTYSQPGQATAIGSAAVSIATSGNAALRAKGVGSLAVGAALCESTGTGDADIIANDRGSVAMGYASQLFATGLSRIQSLGQGAFAAGFIQSVFSAQNLIISASGQGSFAGGSISVTTGNGPATISANTGAFAHGNATDNCNIQANGIGSFATGNASIHRDIIAGGSGSFAGGAATGADIRADGASSFAWGSGAIASGIRSVQFGAGTNAVADSIQVLGTMSVDATNGYFRAAVDGSGILLGAGADVSIYYDGTDLIIDPNLVGTGRVLIGVTGNDNMLLNDIEIDGALNHDGTTIGLYGTAPVLQAAVIAALTDSSGGTASDTVAAVAGSGADATINDNFADLTAKINAILAVIDSATGVGLTA